MPLVFLTTPNEEWYVLSKDKKIRRKGFACSYDHLSNEPVFVSHDSDMRKRSRFIKSPIWVLGKKTEKERRL